MVGERVRGADGPVAAAFVASAVLAGGNAVAIRFSNRELEPLWGAGLRFLVAAAVLWTLLTAMRLPLPRGRALTMSTLWGLLQFAGAFGFGYYALVRIQAGLGQTLLALVPLVTLLLAVAQRQERWRLDALAGSLLGLAGVAVISWGTVGTTIPLLSWLAVFASIACFAQANVVVRLAPPVHPVAMNAIGATVGCVVLLGLSFLAREAHPLPERAQTWAALAYVAVIGSVVVFLLIVFVLQRWDASRAAYNMVLIPIVTVALSAWLDDERVRPGFAIGGALVLLGVYVGALRRGRDAPA